MNGVPKPADMNAERAGIRRQSALAFLLCALALGLAVWWLPRLFEFPTATGDRLAFAARASLLVILWIAVGVRMVARVRFNSAQDNPGSAYAPPSDELRVPRAFLQNTLEQATLASFTILAVATVPGEAPLAFIMGSVMLFAVGRLTFLRGYPRGAAARAFGMATTAIPIVGGLAWVLCDMAAKLLNVTS